MCVQINAASQTYKALASRLLLNTTRIGPVPVGYHMIIAALVDRRSWLLWRKPTLPENHKTTHQTVHDAELNV